MADDTHPRVANDASGESLRRCLRPDCLMLLLARHGERGGPPVAGLAGKTLTPRGRRQAHRLARRLAQMPLAHLYSSDMARAYQTAEPIHALRPDVPFTVTPDLRELSRVDQPDYPPDVSDDERARLHQARVLRFVAHLRQTHHAGEVVAIVAHGGLNRRLIATLAGVAPESNVLLGQHNASITAVSVNGDGRVILRLANCTRHLRPSQIDGDVLE